MYSLSPTVDTILPQNVSTAVLQFGDGCLRSQCVNRGGRVPGAVPRQNRFRGRVIATRPSAHSTGYSASQADSPLFREATIGIYSRPRRLTRYNFRDDGNENILGTRRNVPNRLVHLKPLDISVVMCRAMVLMLLLWFLLVAPSPVPTRIEVPL